MPIPKPKKGEKKQDFISRCMGNDTMKKEYPDQNQRSAVCHSQWKDSKGENMEEEKKSKTKKYTENGRLIIAENVPLIIRGDIRSDEDGE